jgi:hypothetical protein
MLCFSQKTSDFCFSRLGGVKPLGFGSRSSDFGAGLFERERLINAGELELITSSSKRKVMLL